MADTIKLAEVSVRVEAALQLLDTDEADAIIGTPGPEYQTLIQGVEAVTQMHWAGMRNCGARQSRKALAYTAKAQMILLQMMHYAYALGIKRGSDANPDQR